MIICGAILLILGVTTGINLLTTLGVILLIVGVVLFLLGAGGYPLGGRQHWY